jgi:hypothetical protein
MTGLKHNLWQSVVDCPSIFFIDGLTPGLVIGNNICLSGFSCCRMEMDEQDCRSVWMESPVRSLGYRRFADLWALFILSYNNHQTGWHISSTSSKVPQGSYKGWIHSCAMYYLLLFIVIDGWGSDASFETRNDLDIP